MMTIALGQVILESKLAQYASRFQAMSAWPINELTTRLVSLKLAL